MALARWWTGAGGGGGPEGSGAGARRAISTLQGDEKFFCNECGTYQEAQQRTRLSVLPPVLLLHFKRFKTTTHLDRCPPPSHPDPFSLERVFPPPLWLADLQS